MLKFILIKWDGRVWVALICLKTGPVIDSCEHSSELSGSIKCGGILN